MLLSIQSYAPFTLEHSSFSCGWSLPASVGADPRVCPNGCEYPSSARTAANIRRLTPACEHPVLFCLTTSRMPRSFFSGRHRGLPLRLDEKKHRFCAPKLHFRCISNTLQRYKKILKLTNYKHKIFKKFFVGAAILLYIKQLQKSNSKILITNDLCRLSTSFNCPISCLFWLQITDYSLFMNPLSGLELEKTAKYVSKNIYYLYIIFILYINSNLHFHHLLPLPYKTVICNL